MSKDKPSEYKAGNKWPSSACADVNKQSPPLLYKTWNAHKTHSRFRMWGFEQVDMSRFEKNTFVLSFYRKHMPGCTRVKCGAKALLSTYGAFQSRTCHKCWLPNFKVVITPTVQRIVKHTSVICSSRSEIENRKLIKTSHNLHQSKQNSRYIFYSCAIILW